MVRNKRPRRRQIRINEVEISPEEAKAAKEKRIQARKAEMDEELKKFFLKSGDKDRVEKQLNNELEDYMK